MDLHPFTRELQAMLPQWMRMAKDPNSVGAQFLNIFGLEFGDVQKYLDEALSNSFIDTVDLSQIDIAHKVPLALPVITDIEEVMAIGYKDDRAYPFFTAYTLKQFYRADPETDICILDRTEGILYIRCNSLSLENNLEMPYDYIEVNGNAHYEYFMHHVWNPLDEFGMLLGIDRLRGERNAQFKERILDVFRKPGSSTKVGITNAMERELGLEDGEVTVNEFANKAYRQSLLNADGTPSKKLINYVDRINKVLGFTWDNMTWGEAYWRSVEESQIGLEYLPHTWDVGLKDWKQEEYQSGIGDGDELKVTAPQKESDTRKFKTFVGVRGIERNVDMLNPEIHFKYKITAKGKIYSEEFYPEVYKYTVIASEIIFLNYRIRAIRQFYYTTTLDFDTSKTTGIGYRFDNESNPGVEIIDGNTILSKDTDPYLKLNMYMKRDAAAPKDATPVVGKLGVVWEDTDGVTNTFWMDSQEDFTRNDIVVDTSMMDMYIPPAGNVELGFGEFYYQIDSRGSWEEGTAETGGIEFTQDGSIKLKLPKL